MDFDVGLLVNNSKVAFTNMFKRLNENMMK